MSASVVIKASGETLDHVKGHQLVLYSVIDKCFTMQKMISLDVFLVYLRLV